MEYQKIISYERKAISSKGNRLESGEKLENIKTNNYLYTIKIKQVMITTEQIKENTTITKDNYYHIIVNGIRYLRPIKHYSKDDFIEWVLKDIEERFV